MLTLPIWVPFALVIICALVLRAARAWIVVAAIVFGLYFSQTTAGDSIRHGMDRVIHPTSAQNAR